MSVAFALAAVLATGCSNDLSDLFAEDNSQRDAEVDREDAGPQLSPHQAALELFGADCASCIEQACPEQVAACESNPECREEVVGRHACNDPPCHERYTAEYALGSEPSFPLAQCAATECVDQCPLGQDYACAENYRWPAPTDVVSTLRLQLGQITPEGGAAPLHEGGLRVRACPSRMDPDCALPIFSPAMSSPEGKLDLMLPNGGGDNLGYTPFDGFLELSDPERDPPRIARTLFFFDRSWTIPDSPRIDALLVTPQGLFGGLVSTGTGMIFGVALDCRTANPVRGAGLTVEIDAAPDALPLTTPTGPSGVFMFVNVPPGPTEIRALHAGQVVSRMKVAVASNAVTYLWLWPTSEAP